MLLRAFCLRRRDRSVAGLIGVRFSLLPLLPLFVGSLFLFDFAAPLFECVLILGHRSLAFVLVQKKRALPRDMRGNARMPFRLDWCYSVKTPIRPRRLGETGTDLAANSLVATPTAAAVSTTPTAAATASAAFRFRPGFIHGEGPAAKLLAVQAGDGRLGVLIALHFDEAETFAAACVAVVNDLGTLNRPELAKHLVEV
jgi:hypothetical protein